jgi:hypothetical protein
MIHPGNTCASGSGEAALRPLCGTTSTRLSLWKDSAFVNGGTCCERESRWPQVPLRGCEEPRLKENVQGVPASIISFVPLKSPRMAGGGQRVSWTSSNTYGRLCDQQNDETCL